METKIKKPCEYTREEWKNLRENKRALSNAQIAKEIILDDSELYAINLEYYGSKNKSWERAEFFSNSHYIQYRIAPPKFTWEEFKTKNIAVNTKSLDEYKQFIELCNIQGVSCIMNVELSYSKYKSNTCVDVLEAGSCLCFGDLSTYQNYGFTIIDFADIPAEMKVIPEPKPTVGELFGIVEQLKTRVAELLSVVEQLNARKRHEGKFD